MILSDAPSQPRAARHERVTWVDKTTGERRQGRITAHRISTSGHTYRVRADDTGKRHWLPARALEVN